MAPIQFKQSPQSAQTLVSSKDAKILVRETMRISANLASAAPSIQTESYESRQELRFGVADEGFVGSSLRVLCCEQIDGRRWKYVAETEGSGRMRKSSIKTIGLHAPQAPPVNVSWIACGFFVGFGFD